jgi:outer membrane protein
MRVVGAALLLTLIFAWPMSGPAQAEETARIAIVDFERVLISIERGKDARDELERKKREAESTLQQMLEEYKKAEDDFNQRVESHAVKKEVLERERVDLLERQNSIEGKKKALEAKFKATQEEILGPLAQEVGELVQKIGKEKGYWLILHRGSPGLIYVDEALDITELVIKRFDKKG